MPGFSKGLLNSSTACLQLACWSFLAVGIPSAAKAQEVAPPAAPEASSKTEAEAPSEIIVTGSRIVRDGYKAPTPVTVLGKETLDGLGKTNIADALNQLPQLSQSVTPAQQPGGFSGGAIGVNQLNLRSLGTTRTLVLQDGKRLINASVTTTFAAPDANTVPNALVSRVDTVTGGASAVYGSDALAGVVNFIIDHKFTGLKGEAQGGVTTYGDDRQYLTSLTAGANFGPNSRGHVLLSGELAYTQGINGNTRPWNSNPVAVITNPNYTATNGQPFYLVASQIGISNGTPGGLITSGPLRGVTFGPGGAPTNFNYGLVSNNNVMSGGDYQLSRQDQYTSIDPELLRQNVFGRVSYEIFDDFEVYGEGQWARTKATVSSAFNRLLGSGVTVRSDNAFLPASIAARMTALGLTSFPLGTTNGDIGLVRAQNVRELFRWAVGTTGRFGLMGTDWSWDAYYQRSESDISSQISNNQIKANYALAADAVRNPATGAIVCRSSLTDPSNGCVPFNVMGLGVNSQAAINYVTGVSSIDQTLTQNVAAGTLRGEPFSTWAGPVSIAIGIEHRREAVDGMSTARDQANGFFAGNFRPTHGSFNVTEGSLEAVVPLAKDVSWAKSLDVSGAVRATDYSTSGYVTTWKLGASYAPSDDIRFRGTHSRDIRAPNLGELFAGGQSSPSAPLFDPFTNTNLPAVTGLSSGNPNLKPEIAKTTEFGVVLSPTFVPGFQASVDWYKIDIRNAIQIPTTQTVINRCFQGDTVLCSNVQRTNGIVTLVVQSPANVLSQKTEGIDFEVSYRLPLSSVAGNLPGTLSLRALGTYVISLKTINADGSIVEGAGVNGGRLGAFGNNTTVGLSAPKFVSTVFLNYAGEVVSSQLVMRYVGRGKYNNAFIECSTSCPASNPLTIDDNHIASSTIFSGSVTLTPFAKKGTNFFLAVDNFFNAAPPRIGGNINNVFYIGQANFDYYDRIGRTFRAGVRFRL